MVEDVNKIAMSSHSPALMLENTLSLSQFVIFSTYIIFWCQAMVPPSRVACDYRNLDYLPQSPIQVQHYAAPAVEQLKNHISVHFFFSFLPFSFEWAWRAVAHGACGVLNMCSHGVLNRPFIAGKFSLRAPNKLPPYPYETTTLHLLKNHTATTNYHTNSTKYYRHELQTKNHKSPNQHHQK